MTGRYRHITREMMSASFPMEAGISLYGGQLRDHIHGRTLLFVLVAVLVGAGLLTIVPVLAASGRDNVSTAMAVGEPTNVAKSPLETSSEAGYSSGAAAAAASGRPNA